MLGWALLSSIAATILFVALVIAAHVANPEIDARWRMLSELAIGRRGWVMNVAFVVWAISNIALAVGAQSLVPPWVWLSLILVSLGPIGAAFAPADPITTPRSEITGHGRWHSVFGALFILGLPVVTIVFAIATSGQGQLGWWTLGLAAVVWASIIGFFAAVVSWGRRGREPGPDMQIGIPNRVFVAAFVCWTGGVALAALPLVS